MPHHNRPTDSQPLPLSTGEVWEIGRRPLSGFASRSDDGTYERPTLLFVVQADSANLIYCARMVSEAAPFELLDHIRQAMRAPGVGKPRRPHMLRVSAASEAHALRAGLDGADIVVEVSERLDAVDAAHAKAMSLSGAVHCDYRTNAKTTGDKLSDVALRVLYQTAQQFYRKALWEAFDDSEIFVISCPDIDGRTQTYYGVLLGTTEAEFGLALYASLGDLQQLYNLDIDDTDFDSDEIDDLPMSLDEDESDEEAWEVGAELTAQLLSVPSLSLTYAPRREFPPPLLAEAKALQLPVAKPSAYPLMIRTGQGMQLANLTDLRQIFTAVHAILAWDQQAAALDLEDELDETLTVHIPAMADAQPELTVEVTLVVNPFADDDSFIDFDDVDFVDEHAPLISIDAHRIRDVFGPPLFDGLEDIDAASTPVDKSGTSGMARPDNALSPVAKSAQVYTLKVFLTAAPIEVEEEEISREILLLGHHTLHDLHLAIFDAFERWESHLYEFNLGTGPRDQSRLHVYDGDGNPTTTTLDELDLIEGRHFGYTFDLGDTWEHIIEVVSITRGPDKGAYPRLGKKIGAAPPQYPDNDFE